MKTQKDLIDAQRSLKGRITMVRFSVDDKRRTMTHSGLDMIRMIEETASSSRFGGLIMKFFVDLPRELDDPRYLTQDWLDSCLPYELNLYI